MAVSVGFGDFVIVGKAAVKLYNRVRESTGDYTQLTTETKQFSDLLESFRDLVTRVKLSGPQFAQLVEHEKKSQLLLHAVNETIDRYQSLGGKASSLSKKVTWSKTNAHDLRSRITSYVCILQSFHTSISQCAVLDALEWLKLSMQAGRTQCPSIAALSQASNHEHDANDSEWSELTRDLENLGITASIAKTHRVLILRYLETAVAHGELPFRDVSLTLYSVPVGNYQEAIEQVSTWMGALSVIDVPASSEATDFTSFADTSNGPTEQTATTLHRSCTPTLADLRLPGTGGLETVAAGSFAAPLSRREMEATTTTYTCAICNEALGSLVACRHHLEAQHGELDLYQLREVWREV